MNTAPDLLLVIAYPAIGLFLLLHAWTSRASNLRTVQQVTDILTHTNFVSWAIVTAPANGNSVQGALERARNWLNWSRFADLIVAGVVAVSFALGIAVAGLHEVLSKEQWLMVAAIIKWLMLFLLIAGIGFCFYRGAKEFVLSRRLYEITRAKGSDLLPDLESGMISLPTLTKAAASFIWFTALINVGMGIGLAVVIGMYIRMAAQLA